MRVTIKQRERSSVRLKAITFSSAVKATASTPDTDDVRYSTPADVVRRAGEQITGRIADQATAEAGADNTKVMSPLRTTQNFKAQTSELVLWATFFGALPGIGNAAATRAAINECFAILAARGGGRILLPVGDFYTDEELVMPAPFYDYPIYLEGQGREATKLIPSVSFAPGEAVLTRDVAPVEVVIGGGCRNITIDANKLADYAIHLPTGKGATMRGCSFLNARVCEGLFGHASIPRFYEADWSDTMFYTGGAVDEADRPDYNVRLIGYATDNELFRITAANAKLANIKIEPGGNALIGCHTYGSPSTHEANYCVEVTAPTRLIGNYHDGFTLGGVRYGAGSSGSCSIGDRFFWPATTTGDAHIVATGLSNINIMGSQYGSMPAARAKVAFEGTVPSNSQILEGVLTADGQHVVIGHTASLSFGSNGRLQIYGTDFASTVMSLGRFSADNQGPFLRLLKSRSTSAAGSRAIVSSSDVIGVIEFAADDGAASIVAARIIGRVGGTPGTNDMPGQLEFYTTADGAASATNRLQITQDGTIQHRAAATTIVDANSHLGLRSYTVATLPSAATAARMIFVSDGTSNKRLAVSDGTNWRFPDGAIVS